MKILFVNRLFHEVSGGIERMAIALMNELVCRGHDIQLFSWDLEDATTYFPLDPKITWHRLNMGDARKKAGLSLRLRRQWAMRQLMKSFQPDVMIAFQHGPFLTTAIAALGLGIPIIAAERSAPQKYDVVRAKNLKPLIFQTFRMADRITVQSPSYINSYPEYLRERMVAIPNHVNPATTFADPEATSDKVKNLLCIGRFSYPKNQSVLIEAFARIANNFSDWQLQLIGSGEEELKLKSLVASKGLTNQIVFMPAVTDVESYYRNSHLFCLPSEWEGFPNALAEAMAHGLPVVGFAGCDAVKNLFEDGRNGVLAAGNQNAESLALALSSLMQNPSRRKRMGQAGREAMAAYAPQAIYDRWENLFRELAGRS